MIAGIKSQISPIAPIIEPKETNEVQGVGAPKKTNFSDALSRAIGEVDQLQKAAEEQMEGVVLQREGYTSHGATLALEKADIAFQLMGQIRAKIIRAYEDVIRSQV